MYPTNDKDEARKTVSLQNISNRLERLEVLLSRFLESGQVATVSAPDRGMSSGEPQTQIWVQHCANVKAIGTANQRLSTQPPGKSTWQLLLNDGQIVQSASNSDIEMLLQDVRLNLLDFIQNLLPSIELL